MQSFKKLNQGTLERAKNCPISYDSKDSEIIRTIGTEQFSAFFSYANIPRSRAICWIEIQDPEENLWILMDLLL